MNRPGLPAISYRVGDYNSFRQRLLAVLSSQIVVSDTGDGARPLARLTTRADDDPAIALLDAWAVVGDVLTFYQERIANEGYLRTATERFSILELARTIGYELSPGVAASTYLAFTVDDAPGTLVEVPVPLGTPVMSVPSQDDELPQIFETSSEFVARVEFNSVKPRLSKPQNISLDSNQIYLAGTNTQLQPGSWILLVDNSENQISKQVLLNLTAVEAFIEEKYTLISWDKQFCEFSDSIRFRNPQVFAFGNSASLFGKNAPSWQDMPASIKQANGGTLKGGVFVAKLGEDWQPSNNGLPNLDILCLAASDKYVFAGTTERGVFRYENNNEIWEAVNTGFTNFNIQTLYFNKISKHLFAGTPGGGVFRSKDNGATWVPIHIGSIRVEGSNGTNWQSVNTGIPNIVVRSIFAYSTTTNVGTGTIYSEDKTVTGVGTEFTKEFNVGDRITANNQTKTITEINSDISLTVDSAFISNSLNSGTDYNFTTSFLNIPNLVSSGGTISSQGTNVSGSGTRFSQLRDNLSNITITVLEQTRSIISIESDTSLTINEPFTRKVLDSGTSFVTPTREKSYIFVGTDEGIYRTQDLGKNWLAQGLFDGLSDRIIFALASYDQNQTINILAGSDRGVYRSQNHGNDWIKVNNGIHDNGVVFSLVTYKNDNINYIFAGTDNGVYLLNNQEENLGDWQLKGLNSESNPIIVSSLATYEKDEINYLIAGTNQGVFYSQDNGDSWNQVNQGLSTNEITSVTVNSDKITFAGSRFSGFVENEWVNFAVDEQYIDLNTLYPKVLPDSWVVLLDENLDKNNFQAHQIEKNSSVIRNDFSLESEITRLLPKDSITLTDFQRRSTNVLLQSQLLPLATEKLTVERQQKQIFDDPLNQNRVYLNEYLPNLYSGQTLIVSGKLIRAIALDIGGFFYATDDDEITWNRSNQGLSDINAGLAIVSTTEYNYLATPDGVFRSQNGGNWQRIFQIRDTNFKALAVGIIYENENEKKYIYAATASGVFSYQEGEEKWQEMNQGLVHQDVRVLAVSQNQRDTFVFAGTLNGGVFVSRNNSNWVQTNLNNVDVQALVIDEHKIFAGTFDKGIFLSTDNGSTWKQITNLSSETGTISSDDINVTGTGTVFTTDLQVGDTINAGGQTRTIIAIENEQSLKVDASFRPDLSLGTTFTINTGLTNLNITDIVIHNHTIFAGTAGSGVFRSQDNGKRWQQINNNLTDLEIRCLAINRDNNNLFAGTANGVFRSTNQGDFWAPINSGLTNTDVQAIAILNNKIILWGKGILISPDGLYTAPIRKGDLLQVMTPPVTISPTSQKWKLKDRNGFIGEVVTTTPFDLKLQPAEEDDEKVSEICTIKNPPEKQQNPILELEKPLYHSYDPQTVVIYGNVVQATHGETVTEVLGSGDGTIANQSFSLQKPPLTYIPAATATGVQSTLEVRLDGVLWQELDSLYQKNPHLQAYIVRLADDGTANVTFGDGENGTRLPTGEENIIANYRSGIGFDGQVAAESLTLLKKRPLGIVEVTNPLAATGAAPPESRDTARSKAPSKIRTLDRIVSLKDFEDFTRIFAGIGKAQAIPLWNGQTQLLHITIAAADGEEIATDSQLYNKLVEAIDSNRDPIQLVEVDSYEKLLFNLSAKLQLDSRYLAEEVIKNIRIALNEKFAFDNRDFGQNVTASEVIATIQNIEGVVAVDLDALYQMGKSKALQQSLIAQKARWDEDEEEALPAQLLLVNLGGIKLIAPVLL